MSRVSGNPHGTFFLHFQLRHPVVVPPSSIADRAEHGCSTTNVPQSNGIKTNSRFHHLLGSQYLKLCRWPTKLGIVTMDLKHIHAPQKRTGSDAILPLGGTVLWNPCVKVLWSLYKHWKFRKNWCKANILCQSFSCFGVCAFSALTLLVGRREGHPACKNWVVGCWRGYLSEARCRPAYGPADATATHCLLLQ